MTAQERIEEKEFERDFLAGLIMLEEGRGGNPVSYSDAAEVATALVLEKEVLPLHLLKPKV